jgi:signal transduction histidine kinase
MRRYILAVAGPEERQVEVGAEVHDGGSRGPDSRTVLAWAFGIATLLGWSTVAFVYFGMNAFGRTLSFPRALIAGLPDWYLWAAATPGIFWIGQRFTLGRSRWLVLGLHLVVGSLVVLAELGMVVALNRMLGVPSFMSPWREVYLRVVLQYFHLNFMVYWVIVAAAHATRYYQSYRERAMAALALESERNRAALSALQMQLQPHFFFNTLHTIATLVRDDRGEAAVDTIARLGTLFRQALGSGHRTVVPLREELEFVSGYLEIEQLRFADRLTVSLRVDEETLDAEIPSMALQPLVENAVRHGIARDPDASLLSVVAQRRNGALRVEVRNDGPAFTGAAAGSVPGVGLENVRARLRLLYGADFMLTMGPGEAGGAVVALEVPWVRR